MFSWISLISQEIKPGEQASGLAGNNSTTVDYCTGIFSYNIPLYMLESGGFKLPVQLSYSAKGIKKTDKSGHYGLNWNLNCGGVVIRTIRGGVADESKGYLGKPKGYANYIYDDYNEDDPMCVNKRVVDGEIDIFTAIFNGRSIDFIIRPTNQNSDDYIAVPLEKSNVKIDIINENNRSSFDGWIITDERGIKYYFNEKEITSDANIESGVSSNSITKMSFISSWFLTKIEIPGAEDIVFKYSNRNKEGEERKIRYYSSEGMLYYYGTPMKTRTFDIGPYKEKIDKCIASIKQELENASFFVQVELGVQQMNIMRDNMMYPERWISLAVLAQGKIENIEKTLGLLSEISSIEEVGAGCCEIIKNLNSQINLLRTTIVPLSPSAESAVIGLESLKGYFKKAMSDTKELKSLYTEQGSSYCIITSVLQRIECGDRYIDFNYGDWSDMLKSISLKNYKNDIIRSTLLNYEKCYNGNLLSLVKNVNADNIELSSQSFDYFNTDTLFEKGTDYWGYYNGEADIKKSIIYHIDEYDYYYVENHAGFVDWHSIEEDLGGVEDRFINKDFSKSFVLKSINTSLGTNIAVDYESNEVEGCEYGGIRIKSLVTRGMNNELDSVKYYYKNSGTLCVSGLSCSKKLEYTSSYDIVSYSHLKDDGISVLRRGNNGVYYGYAIEEKVGKGSVAYCYLDPNIIDIEQRVLEPYWLYGRLLGVATYDNKGRIVKLQKNKYLMHVPYSEDVKELQMSSGTYNEYIEINNLPFIEHTLIQKKAFDFYIDPQKTQYSYEDRNICLYSDNGVSLYFNPRKDVYQRNLSYRSTIVNMPEDEYYLCYDIKTLLKEQKEYLFLYEKGDNSTGVPSSADFFNTLPSNSYLSKHIEYEYNNLHHFFPTKVISQKKNGDAIITQNKTILDFEPGICSAIDSMRSNNIVEPIIKKQKLLKLAGEEAKLLLKELVTEYDTIKLGNENVYRPVRAYQLNLEQPQSLSNISGGKNIFSCDISKYIKKSEISYESHNNLVFPVQVDKPEGKLVFINDQGTGSNIFKSANIKRVNVDAVDRYRILELDKDQKDLFEGNYGLDYTVELDGVECNGLEKFREIHYEILKENEDIMSDALLETEEYMKTFELIEKILDKGDSNRIEELHKYCRENIDDILDVLYSIQIESFVFDLTEEQRILMDEYDILMYLIEDCVRIEEWIRIDKDVYEYFILREDVAGKYLPQTLAITVDNNREFTFVQEINEEASNSVVIEYSVVYIDGRQEYYSKACVVKKSGWSLVNLDIDISTLPNFDEIDKLEVKMSNKAAIGVLVPKGQSFEAKSYDSKGRVFCKLDGNMSLVRYEYDSFGRMLRIYDRDGNVLKEYEYNLVNKSN
jgi:YD repeat-containing protein